MAIMIQYISAALALKSDRRGVTMLEYGLIAALVAVVVIGAISTLGTGLSGIFTSVGSDV
ncbi:Flp family type IVb pilin [Gluconacetobacter johannae]|uniref:Flp family type IVb pilin n=1 Tax=Gluconacetobacter johannae TaxID=112140 RepID=A0A7W4J711_9PROT|nr:Flp family type IVb pilin [Gluconacetobacter johannae]MBB2175824.1 Flp family type IVb pilin [Gluconacetobacter johannae]